ncbi:MAG: endolytic transglycosylase MltG [Chloroflexota bacterium]|nr:endolytic transglycosylase MltG [Chloroflexota bacterium]
MRVIGGILKAIIGLGMIGAVAAVGALIFVTVSASIAKPKPATPAAAVMFTIASGENVTQIVDNLKNAGIIDSTLMFRLKLKMDGKENLLKAGSYQLTPGGDTDQLIATLTTEAVDASVRFTVIEGKRLEEVAESLGSAGIVSPTHFLELANTVEGSTTFSDTFLAGSDKPADRGLEGYLFPDTYDVKQSQGDNSKAVIKIMLQTMEERFTPEMRQAAADKGRSIHQVLTIASIVQREGVVASELPKIAAVYWNRVDRKMELDADPTTQYAVGKSPNWWPSLDAIGVKPREVDSPFNTYVTVTMPPAPICGSGIAAINAAVYPSSDQYLYFVAKNDGSHTHAFAKTYEEHQRNVILYPPTGK